jgi:hypothetical protein
MIGIPVLIVGVLIALCFVTFGAIGLKELWKKRKGISDAQLEQRIDEELDPDTTQMFLDMEDWEKAAVFIVFADEDSESVPIEEIRRVIRMWDQND